MIFMKFNFLKRALMHIFASQYIIRGLWNLGPQRGLMGYKIWKLIDSRFLENFSEAKQHLICDIDKTYLETPFDSLVKFAQIPFEKARHKITVSGAKEVLQSYRYAESERPLHFISASPPQLRKVLSEKITWDGLTWSSDTFKNQTYNLLQGRFSQVKNQVAYKSAALLNLLIHMKSGSHLHMIGDNAESDPVIYLGSKLFLEGRLSRLSYYEYLRIFSVPRLEALQMLRHIKLTGLSVKTILIRQLDGKEFPEQAPLTDPILYFTNFFEMALYLMEKRLIPLEHLSKLSHVFHTYYGVSTAQMMHYLNDFSSSSDDVSVHELTKVAMSQLHSKDLFSIDKKSRGLLRDRELTEFSALKEDEILKLAKEWKKKLRKEKY